MKRLFVAIAVLASIVALSLSWFMDEARADSCVKWRSPGQPTEYRGNCPETAAAIYVYLPANSRQQGTLDVVALKPGATATMTTLRDKRGMPCFGIARVISLDDLSIPKFTVTIGCRGQDHISEVFLTEDGFWVVRWRDDTTDPAVVAAKVKF